MDFSASGDDVKIWKKCIEGDKLAWNYLIDKYSGLVCRTIIDTLKKFSNPPGIDWKDIYQDVFLKLMEKLLQWHRKATLATYIRAIAYHTTIDCLRERKCIPLENDARAEDPSPEIKILINELLRDLTPKELVFVKLHFLEEWSLEEIAQFLNKRIGAIYTMKSRVLSKLREIYHKHGLLEKNDESRLL
jgi:RNA polymerase sigma factor (sigma-70 family)